jgi:hypothetical protein
VCSLVELLVTTLFQAYAVFYMPPEGGHRPGEGALTCGILFSTLEHVTSTVPAGESRIKRGKNGVSVWYRLSKACLNHF